ncbi:hypothetical protein B0F90DRAFT_1769617 [Multifurca ochricompacta]|uniref:DUF6535 domain-containing protein n=1 Tax=Multifurca ochricompacta TaxID=376703 RepID=A0AAD4LXS9_9AGAM|nr:hypothetical protein B0F90DRAFT_1769617 [Multifurca ochricompacta]
MTESDYNDASEKVWSVYLSEADKEDKALVENWKGDTDGALIFTGLFAVIVAAFTIESYKRLSPDSGVSTVLLLNQLSQQLSALSNGTQISPPLPIYTDSSFRPTSSAIRVNIFWFLSLILSLICALMATLTQQWARHYLELAQGQQETLLSKRAHTRAYLFESMRVYGLSAGVDALMALLHVAVFLFCAGLMESLFSINDTVAWPVFAVICCAAAAYIFLTITPYFIRNRLYRTPFTKIGFVWIIQPLVEGMLKVKIAYSLAVQVRRQTGHMVNSFATVLSILRIMIPIGGLVFLPLQLALVVIFLLVIKVPEEGIDKKALRWTLATVSKDDDIETIIEGIPGFLRSRTSNDAKTIVRDLLDSQQTRSLGYHMNRLIQTCTPEAYHGTTESVRRRRAMISLDTIRVLTWVYFDSFVYGMFGLQIWPSVASLKYDKDPVIALNAVSTGAIAACAYLRTISINGANDHYHPKELSNLVNVSWLKEEGGGGGLYSPAGCHLLIVKGFIASTLPYLRSRSNKVAATSLRSVWETIPLILDKTPEGEPEGQVRQTFLALWAEVEGVSSEEPPDIEGETMMDSESERPIRRLMDMLRPLVERVRALDETR